ncbi:MAG TPA: Gfo/Idh/MocA family oxidoreductase [Chthoniobacterales bacterium]
MKTLRLGIIGIGNMGKNHANSLLKGNVPRCELAAVADANPAALALFPDTPHFADGSALIQSGTVDAVLIATPHYSHTTLGIEALEAGLHVLVEKPISVHKADCERLIAAHRPKKQVFAAMFNQRTDPYYLKLRELIRSGQLGEIRRVNWIITNWFRTYTYYASGGWRATWAGEGGGVLLNQSPHQLDLWQWLFGPPQRLRAFCQVARYHEIEVEDNVTAYMEYKNGATGVFITSTGEAPGTNRLEVTGEQGRVVIENDRFLFTRNEVPMTEFSKTSGSGFAAPPIWNVEIPINGHGGQHDEILRNFTAAVLDKAPLIAPASEGIHSVELANAMLYSSFENKTVEFPLDAKAYEKLLKKKIASSTFVKKASKVKMDAADFSKSFR